ncbi:MAG: long-chain fatty acid--CoA ligase [Chloroflexota bacterium]|nr:MAG: long-chain fatty acid--CoA ligase [Chloroflexota bacterium]
MAINTITDLLRHAGREFASNRCMTYRTEGGRADYSYADVLDRSLRVAALLRARGVQRGDRVVIWGPNRPDWGFAYFGTLLLGAIAVPFDVRAHESFLERIEEHTEPRLTIASQAQQDSAVLKHPPYVTLDTLAADSAGFAPATDLPDIAASDIAVLMYTSGTTGDPKGVILTHGNIASNLQAVPEIITILPYYRFLSLLPLSHIFEQVIGLLVPMIGGASIVYIDTLKPQVIFETMEAEGNTCMALVPQLLQLFMSGIEREVRRQGKERAWSILHTVARRLPFDFRKRLFPAIHRRLGGKFEFFASGGAYLPTALAQRWENMGIKVVQGYGLTEASPIVTANSLERRILDSIGRICSSVEVRIADDSEILIKGPSVFQGYWRDPATTAEAFEDGWYHTGDLGRRSDSGDYYFTGRKKNLIVLASGLNVHAEDVEQVLRETGLVTDAVVVARGEREGHTEVFAVLAMEDPTRAGDAVRDANHHLAQHQRISGHVVWPDADFPRTHTLKVRRPEVERRLAEIAPPVRAGTQAT